MPSRKIRTVENLILFTFPLVLFAGCAGNDLKPVGEEKSQLSMAEPHKIAIDQTIAESSSIPDSLAKLGLENQDNVELKSTMSETSVENDNIKETEQPEPIALSIPDKKIFFFDTNVYKLSEQQRAQLKTHAEYLKANPASLLVINGHADERGTENYNQTLSEQRAKETYDLLISLGVAQDQLLKKGFGELVPLHSENNWDENRRVELEYTDPMMLSSM